MSTSTDGPGAYANASAGNNQNKYYQQSPNYGGQQAPQYGRQYQQPYAQQYQYSQSPQQNQYYANSPPQHGPQHAPQHAPQEGFVRTVPIFFEGSQVPITRANENNSAQAAPAQAAPPTTSQSGSNKSRPEPLNKESFASNQPIPCPEPPSNKQQQSEQQHSGKSNFKNEIFWIFLK